MNLLHEITRHLYPNEPIAFCFGENPLHHRHNPDLLPTNRLLHLDSMTLSERESLLYTLQSIFFTEESAYGTVPPLIAWSSTHLLTTSFVPILDVLSILPKGRLYFCLFPREPSTMWPLWGYSI